MQWQERISQSNRNRQAFQIGELDKQASEEVLRHIFGDELDKQAAFSAFDRISHTKRQIQNMTGATDEKAAELASTVLVKAEAIHNRYGGSLDSIILAMVERIGAIQDTVNDNRVVKSGIPILNMKRVSQAELLQYTEDRLRSELGLTGNDLYRAAQSLMKLAYSLTLEMRRLKGEILAAILDVLYQMSPTGAHVDYLHIADPPDAFKTLVRNRLDGVGV